MITKKLIKPISKVGVANVDLDNYYTKPQVDSKLDAKQDTLIAGSNITIQGNVISANVNGSGSGNVDLSNYYNKSEIDNKITTIDNEINTKQDTLIAGNNITISNNEISANIDLSDYYTKTQIDGKVNTINGEIATKQNTLTAGSNITISNNVISANIPQVDLSNYYNKQEIDTNINSVKGNVANNTNDITNLKAKDTQLENTINTNKQNITTNTSDIANIKTQQATQDQQISSNRDLSNQIIEGLKTLRVFNYIGTFNSQTTYKRNDVVDYNNRLFLSKVDSNVGNTPPSDNQSNTYWLLVDGIQASVDLSDYYTKLEVDNKLQDYLAITTFNNTIQQINTKQQEQDTLISQKANTSDLANYYNKSEVDSKVDTINGEITTIQQEQTTQNQQIATKQDILTAGNNITISNNVISANVDLANYYNKSEIDSQVNTINNELNNKANVSALNSYAKINETNNGEFYVGNKNGKHIWFSQPFQYGGNTYSSIKIRNGKTNYFTMEHNFNTNQSIISNPRGSIQLKNIATPTENNDSVNKAYVDTKIANILTTDLTNYYTKAEVDTKIDWEVVGATTITRENGTTTIPLNGKRFIHLQGRFTQYSTNTGSWNNFTPFTLDTQNYNYMVRFPIYDWNTQTLRASIEVSVSNGNVVLQAYNTSNQRTNYYLWGDVLVK